MVVRQRKYYVNSCWSGKFKFWFLVLSEVPTPHPNILTSTVSWICRRNPQIQEANFTDSFCQKGMRDTNRPPVSYNKAVVVSVEAKSVSVSNLVIFKSRLPRWHSSKYACQRRRCRFNPWVGEIPWEGNGNPLQYSCLGNSMDRRA